MLLYLLSYVSILVQIGFMTLSIAAGLYYLAEIVEEYTVLAKKAIQWFIMFDILLYVLFIFTEDFNWTMLLCGGLAQCLHLTILRNYPYINLLSVKFLVAIAFLLVNHYLAYLYFQENYHSLSEVLGYFTLCLWPVPFFLFISLSVNDNTLPTSNERTHLLGNDDVVTNYFSNKKRGGLLSLLNYAKESLLPQRNKKSY